MPDDVIATANKLVRRFQDLELIFSSITSWSSVEFSKAMNNFVVAPDKENALDFVKSYNHFLSLGYISENNSLTSIVEYYKSELNKVRKENETLKKDLEKLSQSYYHLEGEKTALEKIIATYGTRSGGLSG